MEHYLGEQTPKLGFGLMRLPKLADGSIDVEQMKRMVDLFLEAGMTYFDTAYVYDGGASEKAVKEALVERYPRDAYTLATKMNARVASSAEEAKKQLETSLGRTGAGYFDYYLLHAVQHTTIGKYDKFGLWDFIKEQKEKGVVKHWGFSYHSGADLLDELLTKHPDAEFVQLQLNYADWDNSYIQSRACYEVARKHKKPVVVMEPVKGGALAVPPPEVQKILKDAAPELSAASWAIRFAASQDGILTVLSGMSNVEQMQDNLSFMKDFRPLSEAEKETVKEAQRVVNSFVTIPCTSCHYCTDGCPMQIPIPEIFAARNRFTVWNQEAASRMNYRNAIGERGRASDCLGCGQCEEACPQHIPVIEKLRECSEFFDV